MNTSATVIRLLLWTSQQTESKISVDQKFWLFSDRIILRENMIGFIRSCRSLGDTLYDFVNNCQPFINVSRFLGIHRSTMHRVLFQSLLYVSEEEMDTVLSNVFEVMCYLNKIFDTITKQKHIEDIPYNLLVKNIAEYINSKDDSYLLNIDIDDINQFVLSVINENINKK